MTDPDDTRERLRALETPPPAGADRWTLQGRVIVGTVVEVEGSVWLESFTATSIVEVPEG